MTRPTAAAKRAAWDTRLAAWRRTARDLSLDGSVLLDFKQTRLGDAQLVDVRGTGRLASQVAGRALARTVRGAGAAPPRPSRHLHRSHRRKDLDHRAPYRPLGGTGRCTRTPPVCST